VVLLSSCLFSHPQAALTTLEVALELWLALVHSPQSRMIRHSTKDALRPAAGWQVLPKTQTVIAAITAEHHIHSSEQHSYLSACCGHEKLQCVTSNKYTQLSTTRSMHYLASPETSVLCHAGRSESPHQAGWPRTSLVARPSSASCALLCGHASGLL